MKKEDEIQVNKVLNMGQLFVNLPVMIVMFGLMWLSYYLKEAEIISMMLTSFGFILSFILGWLTWSVLVPLWRIWAFGKIEEEFYYYLKQEAIYAMLIWPDGSFFEKTEIRTKEQKLKIKAINDKIDELMEDEYNY